MDKGAMGLCQVRKSIRKGGKHRNGHPEAVRDAPRPATFRKARREEPERADSENEPGEDSDVALFCEQLATAIDRGTVVDLLGLQPLTRSPAVPSNIAHMRPAHPTKPTSCGPTNIPQVSFANHSARASAATAERLLWNVVATPDMMRAHAQTIRCDAYGRANAYPQL